MKNFFEHKTGLFIIIATVIIAIIIGIFAATSTVRKASVAENITGSVAEPGQIAVTETGGLLSRIASYFGNIKALRQENEKLKLENIELDKKIRDYQSMEKENYELRTMLDMIETETKLDLVAVKVIAKDPSNWYSSFTINKGTNDGIEKNQPVLTANRELIGRVYKVGNGWAEVITVLDPESGIGSIGRPRNLHTGGGNLVVFAALVVVGEGRKLPVVNRIVRARFVAVVAVAHHPEHTVAGGGVLRRDFDIFHRIAGSGNEHRFARGALVGKPHRARKGGAAKAHIENIGAVFYGEVHAF